MLHTKPKGHWLFDSGEDGFFKCFYHILAKRPSSSVDSDMAYKLSFSRPMAAPYEIWLWLVLWFQRRRRSKSEETDDRRTDDDGRRTEPANTISTPMIQKGLGELKYLLISYIFFHGFIPVYSIRTRADNSFVYIYFLYYHKHFMTLVNCYKFLPLNDFFFPEELYIFPYNAWRNKFELAVKEVKVNLASSYVSIAAYHAHGPLALLFRRRKSLKGFWHIWAWRPF